MKNIMSSNIRLVQVSRPRTGSTLLVNILMGLFCPNEPVKHIPWEITLSNFGNFFEEHFIIKTHSVNFDAFLAQFPKYNLYFIESSRKSKGIFLPFRENLITFDYDEFVESSTQPLSTTINNVADKLKLCLPSEITSQINIESCIARINNMNLFYEQSLKNVNWGAEADSFYNLHGSHRSRDKKI